jgi:hypothetical protein
MIKSLLRGVFVTTFAFPVLAAAQSSGLLPPETQLVAVSSAPAATQETFTIAAVASGTAQPDLLVTFTDFQTPAALVSASIVVTQGAAIVGTTNLVSGATTATLPLPAAVGQFTLRVFGTPSAVTGVGTFNVCVAPKATPTACIADASLAGNITVQSAPANPTLSTLGLTLTVSTAGAYIFTYADDQFPVPLSVAPSLALFRGSQAVAGAVPIPPSPATLTLSAGSYTLLGIAQADPTAQAGLYAVSVTGPAGVAPLLSATFPVGTLAPSWQRNNPSAQSLTLTVKDFQFPAALTNVSALVSSGAAVVGSATATGGASNFAALAGPLQVWAYGTAATGAGSFEVDLTSASASLLQSALGVDNGGSEVYAFVPPQPLAAGSYQATANDFEFPSSLSAVQFAVAQNGTILAQESTVGTLQFTAAAGPVVLLVAATPPTDGSGLLDVNVQTGGAAPQLKFDQVQLVNATEQFTSQTFTIGAAGNFDVTLNDLMFPAQFENLALVASSNGAVLGKIYGGGTFPITATPGSYQFTVIGIPAGMQQYGLYGIEIVNAPPTVTLTASPTTVAAGGLTTLSWTTTNAQSCVASGGNFTGSDLAATGTTAVVVAATTTYTLTCTGVGGSAPGTATVTATAGPARSGGGGEIGPGAVALLGLLALVGNRSRKLT